MALPNAHLDVLIEKRARALAIVFLTARPNVVVEDAPAGTGIALVVRIGGNGATERGRFGVVVRGVNEALTQRAAEDYLRQEHLELFRNPPFDGPFCQFLFTMVDDSGWYTWVHSPPNDQGVRVDFEEPLCKPLDNNALADILKAVTRRRSTQEPVPNEGDNGRRRKPRVRS